MQPLSLYVHYPWCLKKCPYCDFNSHRLEKNEDTLSYIKILIKDLEQNLERLAGRKFLSVYLGGGTPSLMSAAELKLLMQAILPLCQKDCEISIECNPKTVDLDKLKAYFDLGITRLSIGIQSFNQDSLKRLGRVHSTHDAHLAVEDAIKAGFTDINLDLMHGLPGQNLSQALDDLKEAVAYDINHLSWYELTLEEDTYFGKHPPKLPDEDILAEIEEQGFLLLEKEGFKRYEVSGYTKNKRCLHNQNYWLFGDYLGIGAGAHGKLSSNIIQRRAMPQDILGYMNAVLKGDDLYYEVLKKDLPFEFMLNRLRIFDPVKIDEFSKMTNLPFSMVEEKLKKASEDKLIKFENNEFYVTEFGKWMLNDILELFL